MLQNDEHNQDFCVFWNHKPKGQIRLLVFRGRCQQNMQRDQSSDMHEVSVTFGVQPVLLVNLMAQILKKGIKSNVSPYAFF